MFADLITAVSLLFVESVYLLNFMMNSFLVGFFFFFKWVNFFPCLVSWCFFVVVGSRFSV